MAGRAPTVSLVIVLVGLAGVGAGAGVLLARRTGEKVAGSVAADGTPVGTFSFVVSDCASGHAFVPGFFGADLRGEGGFDLRVVDSGDDAQLWLYPQGAKKGAIEIRKPDCSEWDVLVEWTNLTVNRVHTVSGHVRVACAVGGGKITASASFERCAR